ncbi:hypothetical protein MJI37_35985, partial [Salmonella enterica subsp. enterica serovar Cerro]|nr:hypothetical protein [Salmonella enterica subsp. enterica serovar Cerro]
MDNSAANRIAVPVAENQSNFMMGGMKGERVSDFRLDDNQPLPGQYDIDIYVNKQWRGKY